jgi:hypothetical protein
MAVGDAYMTVETFKSRSRSAVTANDSVIEALLKSSSRVIDGYCRQPFYKSESSARYFTSRYSDVIEVDAIASISEIATDAGDRTYETIWATTDYDLYPYDAAELGEPYREIRRSPIGVYSWPSHVRGVRITGEWGWPEVPAPVREVCFLMTSRNKSLLDAPFGLSGGGEMGALDMTVSLTPILKEMLAPYVLVVV